MSDSPWGIMGIQKPADYNPVSWGLRHLPQRLHSQESGYSPALKPNSGYSHAAEGEDDARDYEDWEKEEKCRAHEGYYNLLVQGYMANQLEGNPSLEQVNGQIRKMNEIFAPYGCPSLPEIGERPMPTFATKR